MRVDDQLLRRMLETIEAAPVPSIMAMPELTRDQDLQHYHLQLLLDGGYLTAQQLPHGGACTLRLTLEGHRLLDKLRGKRKALARRWTERLLAVSVVRLLLGCG